MKTLKRILLVILTIININIVLALIISFNFQKVLVNGVIKETIKTQIKNNDYEEPNITINEDATDTKDLIITDDETINKILESEEVQELLEEYINKTLESVENPEELENIDFEQDAINYIKENKEEIESATGVEITDEMIEKAQEQIEEKDINKVVKQKIRNTNNNLTTTEKTILKGYSFFISKKFKIILGVIYLINLILIALIEKSFYKWINNLGLTLLIGGLESIFMSLIITYIIKTNTILTNFNANPLIKYGTITLIIGLIIIIIYNIVKKLLKRNGEKYE